MLGSEGTFSLNMGAGIRNGSNYEDTSTLAVVMQNGVNYTGITSCSSGNSYNALLGHTRKVRVSYDDGAGPVTIAQDFHIQAVPYAWYANSLQGLTPTNFVQINPGQNVTQSNLENLLGGTNYNTLFNLASGTSSSPLSLNNQQIKNLADPTLAQDAATKNYADTRVGGSLVNLSGIGSGIGDGRVLAWNAMLNQWEATTPSAITDSTKLPLSGGTMAGNINMASHQVLNTGHITMQNLATITLGKFSAAQETTLVGTLTAANTAATWYNTTTDKIMYWDGDSAEVIGNGSAAGDIEEIATAAGSGLSGGATSGTATLAVVTDNSTLEVNGTNQLQIRDNGITAAKLAANSVTDAKINTVSVNKITSGLGQYFTYNPNGGACALGEVLKLTLNGWECGTDNNSGGVTSVYGRAGVVIAQSGDYTATQITNTPAGNIAATTTQGALNELDTEKLNKSGDTMTGALNVPANGFTVGSNQLVATGGNIGVGTATPATRLDVEGTLQIGDGGETCSIAANAGMIKYASGALQYCNGSAWQTLGVSGAGLTTLNGQTGSAQTFAVDAAGTTPSINSGSNIHTLSIPLASGIGVTSGTISKADYDSFTAKLSSVSGSTLSSGLMWVGNGSNQATAVSMSGDATISNTGALTLSNNAVTTAKINADAVTSAKILDGSVATADIANSAVTDVKIDTVSVNKITSSLGQYLTYNPNGAACAIGEVLKLTVNGWECGTDNNSGGVSTVFGRSGAVTAQAGDYTATQVTNTPAGAISATTTQAAINELDTEKVNKSGDTMTGSLLLPSNGLAVGTTQLVAAGGSVGIGTATPAARLDVEGAIQIGDAGETCSLAANAGMIKYSAGALQYCNGSAWQTLGVSGAGLTTLNGQTGSAQTFAVDGAGTAPSFNSGSNVHTLSIPLASGIGVTSGTISKADYDAFTAKLSAVSGSTLSSGLMWVGNGSNQAAAVSMSGDATLSNTGALTLSNNAVTAAKINADAVTSAKILDGSVATVDIANSAVTDAKIDTVSVNKITSSLGQYLTYNPNGAACAIGEVLKLTVNGWECGTDNNSGGVTTVFGRSGAVTAQAGDYTATQITNTPAGTISATTTQAAINELDTEKVNKSGDTMTGALSVPTDGFTVGTTQLVAIGGNIGVGTATPATRLDIEGTIQIGDGGETCSIAANAGMIKYASGALQYCNGSAWQTLGVSGAGLTALNGQTGSTQIFAVTSTGTAPAITSATNTHTFSIPLASGVGVTSGTISKADYDAFTAKLSTVSGSALNSGLMWIGNGSNQATAVSVSGDATISNTGALTIANNAINSAKLAADAVTSAKILDGSVATVDIANSAVTDAKIDTVSVNKITSALGQYLTYNPNGAACAIGEVLKLTVNGWECGTDNNSGGVTTVFGRSGAVTAQSGDYTATQITNTPAGNIAASTVQAALNELDSEKVNKSGDTMTGSLVLPANGLTVGTTQLVVTGGNIGIGTASPTSRLDVEGTIQIGDGGETCSIAANAGMIKYASGTLQYCNGSAWQTLGVSGAGLTSLNGQTSSTQTFAVNAAGTAPALNSSSNVHTLSIPLASGVGVTSGTISKADYDLFTAKLSAVSGSTLNSGLMWVGNGSNQATAVAMSGDATLATNGALTIANNAVTDAKINSVSISKITSGLGQYLTYDPNGGACAIGEVLKKTINGWECGTDSGGVTDHGLLGGLNDDDHTQYVMLAGRSGGQILRGGIAANNNLTLESTSDATKGNVLLQPSGGNVGIGTTNPIGNFHINGAGGGSIATLRLEDPNTGAGGFPQILLRDRGPGNSDDEIWSIRAKDTGAMGLGVLDNTETAYTESVTFLRNGHVGIGTIAPTSRLDVEGTIQIGDGGETCSVAANAGMIKYASGALQYCNGSSWQTLGVSGAGLTSLNGQTGSTQSFAVNATGTAPAITSATNTHTISIPLASGTGVTSGTISKADYDAFTAKLSSVAGSTLSAGMMWVGNGSNQAAAVAMSGDATLSSGGSLTIASNSITSAKLNADAVTSAKILDGTIATADLANSAVTDAKINTVSVNKITSALGQYLTYAPNGGACTDGEVLKWNTVSGGWICGVDAAGGSPTGAAGGDLAGTYPNPSVAAGAITTSKIADGNVTNAKIASGVDASKITTGTFGGRIGQATGGFIVATKDDITTRTDSGFYQTSSATTAEGWPTNSNGWYHLLSSTHNNDGNYYSMQFAGDFGNNSDLFYRATGGNGTAAWNRVWTSGNLTNLNQLANGPGYITGVNSSMVTTALGYTPVNRAGDTMTGALTTPNLTLSSSDPYITANTNDKHVVYAGGSGWTPTGAVMVQRGVSSGSNSGGTEFYAATSGSRAFSINGYNSFSYNGNNVWHAGNLTNLNQLSNGPGFLTGITGGMVNSALGYTAANLAEVPSGNNGAAASDQTGDMNNLNQKSGFYLGNNPANGPFGTWTTWISAMGHYPGDRYGFQIAKNYWGDDFRVRGVTNNNWGSWLSLWHSGNFNPASYQTALGYTPVNRAGDTMSGALTVNSTITANNFVEINKNWDGFSGGLVLRGNAPTITMNDNDTGMRWMMHNNNDILYFHRANTANGTDWVDKFRIHSDGNLWTPMYGYLGDYFLRKNDWQGSSLIHTDGRHYGTILYDTNDTNYYMDPNGGSRLNTSTTNESYTHGWYRVHGNGGLYWENHGGGWHMQDSSWIRNYNNKPLYLSAPGSMYPVIVSRDNGSYGKVARFETTGGGSQDGPQINFHKQNAKQWSLGIDPGGENGYSIFEDGHEGTWGTRRFRLWNGGGMQLLGGNIDMQSGDSGVNVSGNEFRVWTNNWAHRMTVNQNAHIWTSAYGWLHDQFVQNDSDSNWRIISRNPANSLNWQHSAFEVRPPSGQDGGWATISFHRPGHTTYMIGHDNDGLCFGPSDNCFLRISQTGDLRDPSGNFHIDSNGGNSTFINWFNGTGGLRVGNGGQNYGNVWAAGYYYASDERLKENIQEIVDPVGTVLALHGVSFDWKADRSSDLGFIAQEVEKVLPNMVKTSSDESGREIKSVKYGNIVAVVVEAVKEIWIKLTTTEKRVDQVELRLKAMEDKIQALELENARLKQEQLKISAYDKFKNKNRKPASVSK